MYLQKKRLYLVKAKLRQIEKLKNKMLQTGKLLELLLVSKIIKSILLFIFLTILIQVFYAVSTNTTFFSSTLYFPYGYAVHIIYYLSFLVVTFLFVGKFDFSGVGLKRVASWRKYLLIGMFLALLGAGLKIFFVQGSFGPSFYSVPYYLLVPAFLVLGTLIGVAEESAFRGYILKNFLEKYKPLTAILFASILFGAYHINSVNLNYYTLPFWSLYVMQAFTGGLIMASLFYKTGGNLVASIAYHSTNIIVGQIILWMPILSATYVLAIEIGINIVLVVIINYLPTSFFHSRITVTFRNSS
jgi:membrane protease YdiL (CAAX protease family)